MSQLTEEATVRRMLTPKRKKKNPHLWEPENTNARIWLMRQRVTCRKERRGGGCETAETSLRLRALPAVEGRVHGVEGRVRL